MSKKFLFMIMLLSSTCSYAAVFTPGNLVVSTNNNYVEFTVENQKVQSFSSVYPGGYPATEYSRDIAIDTAGNMHVYNGTFNPYLSTYNSSTGDWSHSGYQEFSTVNNGSYGGIDLLGDKVFLTDMSTAGSSPQGVVAVEGANPVRFAEHSEPIDLTLGLDGFLYTLSPGGSPGGRTVEKYDPATNAFLASIDLTGTFGWTEHRTIAVDWNGDMFIADWDGEVHHLSQSGVLISTINPVCDWSGTDIPCEFIDIDISEAGSIGLGTRFGEVFVTDTGFSNITTFDVGSDNIFVEFVPLAVPLPASIWMFGSALLGLFGLFRKR